MDTEPSAINPYTRGFPIDGSGPFECSPVDFSGSDMTGFHSPPPIFAHIDVVPPYGHWDFIGRPDDFHSG